MVRDDESRHAPLPDQYNQSAPVSGPDVLSWSPSTTGGTEFTEEL
jgi:hypothetical protein